jgi:colanic acid biosynthesis protein WcaH
MNWFSNTEFLNLVDSLPIISIDLCIISDCHILLGKRKNEPAKDYWFTPGGRIFKNESIDQSIQRIAINEVGFKNISEHKIQLMGAWDHFYSTSRYSENISTHYVNLPHYILVNNFVKDSLLYPNGKNDQHYKWMWVPLKKENKKIKIHKYSKNYIDWLIFNLSLK